MYADRLRIKHRIDILRPRSFFATVVCVANKRISPEGSQEDTIIHEVDQLESDVWNESSMSYPPRVSIKVCFK